MHLPPLMWKGFWANGWTPDLIDEGSFFSLTLSAPRSPKQLSRRWCVRWPPLTSVWTADRPVSRRTTLRLTLTCALRPISSTPLLPPLYRWPWPRWLCPHRAHTRPWCVPDRTFWCQTPWIRANSPPLKLTTRLRTTPKRRVSLRGSQGVAGAPWAPLNWRGTEPVPGGPWAPPEPRASRPARVGRWGPPERPGTRWARGDPPAALRACPDSTNWPIAAHAAGRPSHIPSPRTKTSCVRRPVKRRPPLSDRHMGQTHGGHEGWL